MTKDILYKASGHQRHQWDYHKLTTDNAQRAEQVGVDRYQSFDIFTGEIYHRMYSDAPQKVDTVSKGSEVFQKLDSCIDDIPELSDLKIRCTGDEHYSGIMTTSIIDELLKATPAPKNGKVENPQIDADTMEVLKQMLESAPPEQQDALQDAIEQCQASHDNKVENAKHEADMLDASDIRNALRKATKQASDDIQADQELVASLSAGTSCGDGKTAKKALASKLRGIVFYNPRMKEIAKLAGRLQRIASLKQREKIRSGVGQIDGVTLGDSINQLLPSELVYLDGELENVFNAKYVQKSLLNWELNNKESKQKGAIVMLLDSSLSMKYGHADHWAGAVAMAFMDIAKKQDRAFAIVHFGNEVLRVDSWASKTDWTPESLIDAVSFFDGDNGTDFMPPLDKGIDMIRKHGAYKNADIVMVTDGYAPIDSDWLDDFKNEKAELEFNVYSILVGEASNDPESKESCDKFSDETVSLANALQNDKAMQELFGKV